MNNIVKKIKIINWLYLFLGLGAAISILLCYFYFVNEQNRQQTLYVIYSICSLVGLTVLFFFITLLFCYKLDKYRHKTSLKAANIVGNDIGAAYDFGEIGIIVCDQNGTILWINDFLINRGLAIVDYPIKAFSLELAEFFTSQKNSYDSSKSITFKNGKRFYDAKFIPDANLFILKDVTKYESLVIDRDNHMTVIGYLNIDNYSDINFADELERVTLETNLKMDIINYFKKYDALLKPLRTDLYMILLNRENFDKMILDKFSIIPNIANEFSKKSLTISLGFGYGFLESNFNKNNDLASSSLDVALSRGGNQVVVAPFGEAMQYFGGGNTESQNKTNKVKINTFAKSFITTLKHSKNIIIIPHRIADMDAIGAALGVYAICKSLKVPARIVYDSKLIESATDHAVRASLPTSYFEEVFANFETATSLKNNDTLLVIVDHDSKAQSIYPPLIDERFDKIAVIDHHRKQDNSFKEPVFEHIDSSSSSTCELLALYFDSYDFKVEVTKEIATLMMSGIYLDTSNFKTKTRILTHEACIILNRLGASEERARDFLKENLEFFEVKSKMVASFKTYVRGILIATGDEETYVNSALLASVCNELKDIESTRACFAVGRIDENRIGISSRGNGQVNCELLMQQLEGGGHFSAAATVLKDTTIEQATNRLKHVLDEYLKDATNTSKKDEDEDDE